MTRIDGLVRGMPRRIPTPFPNASIIASGTNTGGTHTFAVPDNVHNGDLVCMGASSRNADISAIVNTGTGASWNQIWMDTASNEEIRFGWKVCKNETGSWQIPLSSTNTAGGYFVLRINNPAQRPTVFGGQVSNQSSTSQPIVVPSSSIFLYMRAGCYNGGVAAIGAMTTQEHTFIESAHAQYSVDSFISLWWAEVPHQYSFSGIYRAGNDGSYQGSNVVYARKAG